MRLLFAFDLPPSSFFILKFSLQAGRWKSTAQKISSDIFKWSKDLRSCLFKGGEKKNPKPNQIPRQK